MNLNRVLNGQHIGFGYSTNLVFEPRLVGSHDLVGHCLAALPADRHHRLAGVLPPSVAGQRHNHHPRQIPVGRVVAHDACPTGLAYLAADCRVKLNPPPFTALHRPCLRQERCTTPSRRLRAPCRKPSPGSHHRATYPPHAALANPRCTGSFGACQPSDTTLRKPLHRAWSSSVCAFESHLVRYTYNVITRLPQQLQTRPFRVWGKAPAKPFEQSENMACY